MIVGIGCDFVSHSVTKKLKWESDAAVQAAIFSTAEIAVYKAKKNIRFLAGRYAGKEAVLKCLGCGMEDGLALTNIEILDNDSRKPQIKLSGQLLFLAEQIGITTWFISISHAPAHSLAFVVAEGAKG